MKHVPESLPNGLTVTERDKEMIVEAVNNACAKPYSITEFVYNVDVAGAQNGTVTVKDQPAEGYKLLLLLVDGTSSGTTFTIRGSHTVYGQSSAAPRTRIWSAA